MKKTIVNVSFEDQKLFAAKLYMEQKGLSFEDEMSKAADALYGKYVPANVREFLEMSADSQPGSEAEKDTICFFCCGRCPCCGR